jgi:hypothetical protein
MKPNLFSFDYLLIAFIAIWLFANDVLNRLERFAQETFCLPLESHHRLESVL